MEKTCKDFDILWRPSGGWLSYTRSNNILLKLWHIHLALCTQPRAVKCFINNNIKDPSFFGVTVNHSTIQYVLWLQFYWTMHGLELTRFTQFSADNKALTKNETTLWDLTEYEYITWNKSAMCSKWICMEVELYIFSFFFLFFKGKFARKVHMASGWNWWYTNNDQIHLNKCTVCYMSLVCRTYSNILSNHLVRII